MRIHLTARHCEIDPEDRLLVEQRLEKLSRFTPDILDAHVIVTADKSRYTAEITVKLPGHEAVSREEAHGVRVGLELSFDRLEHQLRRLKERRLEWRRGDRTRAADLESASSGDGPEERE